MPSHRCLSACVLDDIISAAKRLADRLLALYPTQKEAIDKATTGVYRFFLPYNSPVLTFVNPFFDRLSGQQ